MPIALFLLVLAVIGVAVYSIEAGEAEGQKARMHERAQAIASALERRGSTSSSYLRAGAAMVSSMSDVPPDLFPRFVSQLQLDGDYRGADGIGWAQVITPGEVPEFERRGRAMGWRDFAVNPAPKSGTKRLVPVTFLQPDTVRNRRAMGYDMYSQPTRREAMDEADVEKESVQVRKPAPKKK